MKILQVNVVCGTGSTGRIAVDLQQVLIDQGHECKIAYGRGRFSGNSHVIKIGSKFDNYFHWLRTRIFDGHGFGSKQATNQFIKAIEEFKPDVVHLHNLHGYYINIDILFRYLNKADIPIVWSLYDCWSFTGHCAHFDYVGCEKWKSGCYRCIQKYEYPASMIFDRSRNNYLKKRDLFTKCNDITIVPPTNWLACLVKDSFLNVFPAVVIPSGIDLNQFKPTENKIKEIYKLNGKYLVLAVADGFHKFKGSEYLIKLAESLPEKYQVVIVGVKEDQTKHFPNNIIVLPRTNNISILAQFYTAADVFVNPTLQETQGLTSIEALACGTPVVAFNSGGVPECINSSCGVIVDRGDLEGLIQAVQKTCLEPFDREDCIQNAQRFNKRDTYKKYIDIYRSLCN